MNTACQPERLTFGVTLLENLYDACHRGILSVGVLMCRHTPIPSMHTSCLSLNSAFCATYEHCCTNTASVTQ